MERKHTAIQCREPEPGEQLVDLSGKTVWMKPFNLQKGQNFLGIDRTTEVKAYICDDIQGK